jgi:DeoR/GlpR family transcriptional regulator of sugar metabolism
LGGKISGNEHKLSIERPLLPEERRLRLAERIRLTGSVTVGMIEEEFGISPMTARRDLKVLEQEGRARRIHGGAVLPELARHEDSFGKRLEAAVRAKERLARAAVGMLEPGETVCVDSSTTTYHAARLILERGLRATVLTNSAPVVELFAKATVSGAELVGVGGSFRQLTLSFVGPHAVRTIAGHFADKCLFSVKGITPEGYLTDPDPLETEVKRTMIARAEKPILLVDGSKFERRGSSVIAHISEVARVLAADAPEDGLATLKASGVEVQRV